MALIADCDAAVTAVTDGWITDAGSTNVPTCTKMELNAVEDSDGEGTYVHPVFVVASFTNFVVSTTLLIQEAEGIDETSGQTLTTKYQRVSSDALGHTVGTDFGPWYKVS
jgi:hypothetical protein